MAPTQADPLADVDDTQELARVVAQANELYEQCELHPEGFDWNTGATDKDGNPITKEIDGEEIPKIKVWAHKILNTHAPARREYLRVRAERDAEARELYPEIFNPESEERQQITQVISRIPELLRAPSALLDLGRWQAGLKLELERKAKKNGKQARSDLEPFTRPQPPIPPNTVKVRGGETTAPVTKDRAVTAAKERLIEEDTGEAAEELIGAIFDRSRQQRGGREKTLT